MSQMPDGAGSAELQHDLASMKRERLVPVGEAREDWLNTWTASYIRQLPRTVSWTVPSGALDMKSFDHHKAALLIADNDAEALGQMVIDAAYASFREEAQEAFDAFDFSGEEA